MSKQNKFKPQSSYQTFHMADKYNAGEHSLDFLSVFSEQNPMKMALLTPKHYEALCAWNNLQHTPSKRRNFTFTMPEAGFSICQPFVKGYVPKWAYICHDKDDSNHVHYHLYVEYDNPRSFASVANELHIPVNQLQGVISKRGILSYLTHDNEPDKHHYDESEIFSNFDIVEEKKEDEVDVMAEAMDYYKMRMGQMTYIEFLQRHQKSISRCNTAI